MKLWKGLLPALMLLALVAAMPAAALTAPPPPLTGETFTGTTTNATGCNNGNDFTATYTGTATGPYTGTFTETVAVDFNGPTVKADFTITTPTGTVSGTKTLNTTNRSYTLGLSCQTSMTFGSFDGRAAEVYTATIRPTTGGAYRDAGTAQLQATGATNGTGTLTQSFVSTQMATTLIVPTSAGECKNGGYQNFGGLFKNQGDCESFVATGGKNPPSGA